MNPHHWRGDRCSLCGVGSPSDADCVERWYFTFGVGQPNAGHFIVFPGTYEQARERMNNAFNGVWAFQYSEDQWYDEEGLSQEARWGLTRMY